MGEHEPEGFDDDFDDAYEDDDEDGEGLSVRRPETPDCPECGRPRELRPTDTGHWILLEPGTYPVAEVSEARRWFDADDGWTVVHGPGGRAAVRARPGRCRVAHRPVCAAREPSSHGKPLRVVLWSHNRAAVGLPYE